MTKPSNIPGPSIILKQGPDFLTAHKVLNQIRSVLSQTHACSPTAMDALEQTLKKWQDWRPGDPECASTWLVETSTHNVAALAWIASDMELRGTATTANIALLRTAAADMRRFLKATAEPAPVVAVKPPQDSYPSAMVTRKAPKPAAPVVPVTLSIAFGPDRHEITFPVDLADREDCGHYVTELLDAFCLLRTMAPITERWVVKPEGDVLEAGPNPNALAVRSGIDRLLSRLRAIGAVADDLPIDPRDAQDYQFGATAVKIERGLSPERGMSIGSRS